MLEGLTPDISSPSGVQLKGTRPFLTEYHISKLFEQALKNETMRDAALFAVGINTGVKVSELLTIDCMHLTDDSDGVKIRFPKDADGGRFQHVTNASGGIYIREHAERMRILFADSTALFHMEYKAADKKMRTLDSRLTRHGVDFVLKEYADLIEFPGLCASDLRRAFVRLRYNGSTMGLARVMGIGEKSARELRRECTKLVVV